MLNNHKIVDDIESFFTKEELELINQSAEANIALTNQRMIAARIYSAKLIANASEKLKISNEKMAKSNDRYASAMTILTSCLFFVASIQMFIQSVEVFGNSIFTYSLFIVVLVLLFAFPFRKLLHDLIGEK